MQNIIYLRALYLMEQKCFNNYIPNLSKIHNLGYIHEIILTYPKYWVTYKCQTLLSVPIIWFIRSPIKPLKSCICMFPNPFSRMLFTMRTLNMNVLITLWLSYYLSKSTVFFSYIKPSKYCHINWIPIWQKTAFKN